MNLHTLLLVVLIIALVGSLPRWPYSAEWGYTPSGSLGVIVAVLIILLLLGKL